MSQFSDNKSGTGGSNAVASQSPVNGTEYKAREEHRGPTSLHLSQTHYEKDRLDRAARKIDEGPSFGTPGEPPSPNPDSLTEIEQAFEDLGRENDVVRSG